MTWRWLGYRRWRHAGAVLRGVGPRPLMDQVYVLRQVWTWARASGAGMLPYEIAAMLSSWREVHR